MEKTERSEPTDMGEERSERSEPTDIGRETRDRDDPARLLDEARAQIEKHAAELRAAKVPIGTEPAAAYRP